MVDCVYRRVEKMTRRERKEMKLQKRLDWAESKNKKANIEHEAGKRMADAIPLGQPILVGHHSEKQHRNYIKKIQDHSSKVVEHLDMAKHHRKKADNILVQLDHSIFSDDLDAEERLREKIDKLEWKRKRMKEINKVLKAGKEIELSPSEKKMLDTNKKVWGDYKFMPYELINLGATIRNAKKRIEKISEQKITKSKRYITLLSIAEEKKINHGKSWKCTGKEICCVYC